MTTGRTVLIAPDSFKGSLTSVQVARALADGWARARPQDEVVLSPLADGGEGTLDAVAAAGGWDVADQPPSTTRSGVRSAARWLARSDGHAPSSRWPRPPACRGSEPDERDPIGGDDASAPAS